MLKEFFDTSDEWIRTRTGIETRRIMTDECLLDLATTACKRAIEAAGICPEELDYIVCSNVSNNYVYPTLSSMVQGAIGATCPCIDLRNACAGYVYALDLADMYLQTRRANKILVLAAEEPTRFCHWEQRETSVLFGDGAGAVVVEKGDGFLGSKMTTVSNTEVLYQRKRLESTPFEVEGTYIDHIMVMNGREVFRMAVSGCSSEISHLLQEHNLKTSDIKYFILHQANMRIINGIQQHLDAKPEQCPTTVQKYGNTSSASMVILFDELVRANKIQRGDLLVFSGFGAGFTTGSCIVRY